MVVDGHMHVLPARARAALDAVMGDAFAHVPEAAQFLGVQVEQLPRLDVLVANDGGCGARGRREWPYRRSTLPTAEAGRPSSAPSVTGSAPLRWRAARISASAAVLSRRGRRCGVDGRS